jgi:anti-anti-sigma regulatory factor
MTLSDARERLFATICQLVEQQHTKILINLVETPYLDSDGLIEIVNGCTVVGRAEGTSKPCGVTQRIRNLLRVSRLTGVLDVFESEQDAVDSFRPPA